MVQDCKWVAPVDLLTHWPTEQSECDPHMIHLIVNHMLKFFFF